MTLATVIAAIQTAVAAISGIKHAPAYPPDKAGDFPFAVVYPSTLRGQLNTPQDFRIVYDVRVELHVAHTDLSTNIAVLYGYAESVPNAIFSALVVDNAIAHADIQGTFGALEWAGAATIGFVWTVREVKVITTIT